jgi:hypothetical protein
MHLISLKESSSDQDHAEYSRRQARILAGCYRNSEASDPEIYGLALAAVLADYPREVIAYVTDPRTGIARRLKWLPSIAEVIEACEAQMAPLRRLRAAEAQRNTDPIYVGNPEERARIADRFKDLGATLRKMTN